MTFAGRRDRTRQAGARHDGAVERRGASTSDAVTGSHRTLHMLPVERWVAWRDGPRDASYEPEGYAGEGFVHCTDAPAVLVAVANLHYAADPRPYVVLELDLGRAGVPWRYDDAERRFPHVYGALSGACVTRVAPFHREADGRFTAIGPMEPAAPG